MRYSDFFGWKLQSCTAVDININRVRYLTDYDQVVAVDVDGSRFYHFEALVVELLEADNREHLSCPIEVERRRDPTVYRVARAGDEGPYRKIYDDTFEVIPLVPLKGYGARA